ncbi:MAG: hypothetical protein RIS99_1219 [Bacteroidota bacterium]
MKKLYFGLALALAAFGADAQYLATGRAGGNGQAGVTFNLRAYRTVIIDTIWNPVYGAAVGDQGMFEVWTRNGFLTSAPTIAGPTWKKAASGMLTAQQTATGTTTLSPLPTTGKMILWAGQNYGFYIGNVDGACGTIYTNWAAGTSDSAANGDISMKLGTGAGFGGPIPNPTFTPRQFTGAISYTVYTGTSRTEVGMNAVTSATNWGLTSGAYSVTGNFANIGLDTVRSIVVSYQVGTGTTFSDTLTGLNVLPGATYNFTCSTPWNPTAVGNYALTVSAINPNGAADIMAANNALVHNVTVQNAFDMSVTASSTRKNWARNLGAMSIKGVVKNVGSAAITSFTMNYSVNGGTPVSYNVTGVNVAPFNGTYSFNFPTGYAPAASGSASIKMFATNLNGTNNDGNNANDTLTHTTNVVDNGIVKKIMYEGYSSSTCGPCVSANVNMKGIFDANPTGDHEYLKFQMNWPGSGDPYYNADNGNRRTLYNFNSIPYWRVDGVVFDPRSWNQFDYDTTSDRLSSYAMSSRFWVTNRDVNVDVTINPTINVNNTNLRLFVAVAEKLTTGNVASNGETQFNHVVHKMLPNGNGNTVGALTAGTPRTFNLAHTFPAGRVPEQMSDLMVVSWIQDIITREVFQSNEAVSYGLAANMVDGTAGIKAVFPNPAKESTTVAYEITQGTTVSYQLVNQLGQIVIQKNLGIQGAGRFQETIGTQDLAEGVYLLKMNVGGENFVQKLSVRK